jgi:DNA helicase-2/ATP-dependent DNA helicase PcrA
MRRLRDELVNPWRQRRRMPDEEWDVIDQIIERTDDPDIDLPLAHFAGHTEGSGRLNLSTLHSAKAREFDAVVLFAMNVDSIPSGRDKYSPATLNEARRLFYVGVSRARHDLHIVFRKGFHSPWVKVLYDDVRASRG